MKKLFYRILPILLVLLLLSECGTVLDWLDEQLEEEPYPYYSAETGEGDYVPYSQMEYQRPDPEAMRAMADELCSLAEGSDADVIMDKLDEFYEAIDWFATCSRLADIHYSADLTDSRWEEENAFCLNSAAEVDQLHETVLTALAASPCRKRLEREYYGAGALDDYEGEGFWDDGLVNLMNREQELINLYYSQSAEYDDSIFSIFFDNSEEMAQTLVDLIRVRWEIAAYCGYDSYEEFANDYYYYRDYDAEDMKAYLAEIARELVPLYRRVWDAAADLPDSREAESFAFVRDTARTMGGIVWDAFSLMEQAGLYDIGYSKNKYNSSFEVYLNTYEEPFLFLNPTRTQSDHLTMAHEFGHFCNDYASHGTVAGIDVNEVFSQAMEYLMLCYGADTQQLTRAKLADSLCTYVEQACCASFEQEMYRIPEEQLSVQALYKLYDQTAKRYGFDAFGYEQDEFVTITHFYTNPMYVSSYIISNDAAMQIYQMELAKAGSGLKCMTAHLDTTEAYFMSFLKSAGLDSPFTPGRLQEVRQQFEATLAA